MKMTINRRAIIIINHRKMLIKIMVIKQQIQICIINNKIIVTNI